MVSGGVLCVTLDLKENTNMEKEPYFTVGMPPAKPKPNPNTTVARSTPEDLQMLQGIQLHSSSPREGLVSMSDPQGNRQWIKKGRNVNGWNVHYIHPEGTGVVMERNGVFMPMPIQSSAPTPYTSPVTKEQLTGTGTMSDSEQGLINTFAFDGDPTVYMFDRKMFERIKLNSQQSPNMSDADKSNIIHFDDYKRMAEAGELEIGKRYLIPRMGETGEVDFDIFTKGDESE